MTEIYKFYKEQWYSVDVTILAKEKSIGLGDQPVLYLLLSFFCSFA